MWTSERRKLLDRLLKKRGADRPPAQAIPRRGQAGPCPLSFAQQRLWFLDQLEPGSAAYNLSIALELRGPLHLPTLEQSLNAIVQRHDTLRTTFATIEVPAEQIIAATLHVTLPVVDLQHLPVAEREVAMRRLATAEAQRPFDLRQGPLVRATVVRLGEAVHVLLVTMHHIISDGWSLRVVMQELGSLYAAFAAGQPSPLAELPIQYADFTVWQQQGWQGEALDTQLTYWREQLAGAPPVLDLPTDRPRSPLQTYRGTRQELTLSASLTQALKVLSRQAGATLFMTLLAAFKTLLYRYTGQDDLVVGTPIAGRHRVEIEPLIGLFVNVLTLRTDLSGMPSFRELLRRVQAVALGAYAHQELPFEKLVEALQPERNMSYSPVFQVMLVLQNTPSPVLELPGLTVRLLEVDRETVQFDIVLPATERDAGLHIAVRYNTDLFDAVTMTRLLGHWQTLLQGLVAAPDQAIAQLPLLTAAERQQVLLEWNATEAAYPREQCLHELVQAQVARTPDTAAVVCGNAQLTYGELNRRANQLAHYLRRLGVGPEIRVGLCLERCPELLVGLLGILKAGGAYVPLDATYPAERLAFMMEMPRSRCW